MARESFAQLIDRKAALNAEKLALNGKQAAADEQLLYSTPQSYASDKIEAFKAGADVLQVEAKLNRAHLFGLRFSGEAVPQFCMRCFVDQSVLSHVVSDPDGHWSGDLLFMCPACGEGLQVARVEDL